ncbi:MAG: nucleoside kinase [Clostridium sp.]|nr:nucleoside kinase [Clostridium sp.]MCM1548169.1 nucleoside kinase [Ruminococcus sp.]
MKCLEIKTLNKNINENTPMLVSSAENNYSSQIEKLCKSIYKKRETHPVLLISGPSGSGKTTTAHKISGHLLKKYGCKSSVISLDNYFRPNSSPDMPRDKNGKLDLESPYCTDLPLLQDHLKKLESGEEFMMPEFDFKTQDRSGYTYFKREEGSIAILEGIHALNPLVTGDCGDFAVCAYISVRTRLQSDTNRLLHPRRIRLMRRLCRDCLFRGRDIHSVFDFFESVSEGEDKYILPFKKRADFQIDTFMTYEVPVYKNFLEKKLETERESFTGNKNYRHIMEFFGYLLPLNETEIPENSLIREFIG